ncbi:hypothetical protein WICMUC_001777 [Wickerhamomyces mucosus]|uniref:Uncharacterized protein n=1 Tax=Wickerhamomyces mucosus TaxID=1378264 RepID=A0A9P8TG63_9ASCO|nr:hypothetical protein WICMUC_001777 [Wickerhamomyces mucosus]
MLILAVEGLGIPLFNRIPSQEYFTETKRWLSFEWENIKSKDKVYSVEIEQLAKDGTTAGILSLSFSIDSSGIAVSYDSKASMVFPLARSIGIEIGASSSSSWDNPSVV